VIRRLLPLAALAGATASAALMTACGDTGAGPREDSARAAVQTSTEPLPPQAPSIGIGRRYRPPSLSRAVARGARVNGMRCTAADLPRFGAHLELFHARKVVIVAPGIGVAPPRNRSGAYVDGGRCSYPLRTREPTGVIEVAHDRRATLGDLFALWGQPLSRTRMAGFRGRVSAYVAGRRWRKDPRAIPLTRHAQVVLEVGGYIEPHRTYRFPAGL
jgi:hypothetical protein